MITVAGKRTTFKDLKAIKPERPEAAGSRWQPIPHSTLTKAILDEVKNRGWEITEKCYTTGRNGADMAGAIGIKVKGSDGVAAMPNGMGLSLGWVHSNARRAALRLTAGATVFCCANGMCTGTILMRRVHDHTVDLHSEISTAMDKYLISANDIPKIVQKLQKKQISDGTAAATLMNCGMKGLIGWSTAGRVFKEYMNPTFAEHGKNTSWALLNAFTYAARPNIHPTRQMDVYNQFREMLPIGGN